MCVRVACNFNVCKPHVQSTEGDKAVSWWCVYVLDHHTGPSPAIMSGDYGGHELTLCGGGRSLLLVKLNRHPLSKVKPLILNGGCFQCNNVCEHIKTKTTFHFCVIKISNSTYCIRPLHVKVI